MNRPTPFRFDGHGINDAEGQRLCKVSLQQFIDTDDRDNHPSGLMDNPDFIDLSRLFKAAPNLLDSAKEVNSFVTGDKEAIGPCISIRLPVNVVKRLRKAILETRMD